MTFIFLPIVVVGRITTPSADINMIFRKIMDCVVNDNIRKYDDIY